MKMEDKRTYDLDVLRDAWQDYCTRMDQRLADLPPLEINFDVRRTVQRRRRVAAALAVAVACLAALVWLLCVPAAQAVDAYDTASIAVGAVVLLGTLASCIALLRRTTASHLRNVRIFAVIAAAALVLVAATPAYPGRATTAHSMAGRTAAITATHQILSNTNLA